MRLAVILVHYHTPELAAAAVEALRRDAQGLDVEWLLIDNGSDEPGRALLESLPVERIDPGTNLGYAGGVNLGVARSSAEMVVLMNPDVLVLPGCLPALAGALRDGAAIAGPRFFWDSGQRMLLPPAEPRTRRDEILALLARRGPEWGARARRRWRRHARRHWQARQPLPSDALSGSLLALRRSAWERVGPFDEGFRLYFEETDWLARARRRGLPAWYVPASRAVHLHDQSAMREPRSREWFEESARRFRELHYGAWFAGLLEGLDRRLPARSAPLLAEMPPDGLDLSRFRFPLWVEVSPNPTGFPAAAELLAEAPEQPWSLAPEIAGRLPAGELIVQVTGAGGRELDRRVLRMGGPA
ncbi:MAG TPA: glycosyltransferase [Thermoanaerobaculia bacterium]